MAGAWIAGIENRKHRLLALAVLCSVALHLALLYLVPLLLDYGKAPPALRTLSARLAAPKPPETTPKTVEESQPARLPVAHPVPAARTAPRPQPESRPPAPGIGPARQASESAQMIAAAPALPSPAIAASKTDPRPASQPASPASSAPDAGGVAQYRLDLMDIARRHKRYPRLAIDNNWEGRVDLRMVIGADGAIASLSVKKSAGYAALDEEALSMFRTAKSRSTIPPALRGKEFALDLSADFYFLKE